MNAPSQRYLSVWLKRLSTDRIERCSPSPDKTPLIIVEPVKSALRICALNDAAASCGLKVWMPLADARAMYPNLRVEKTDPQADHALLEAVADWCDRYTPLVGLDAPDGLFLDISGCAHLFGGERELVADILRRLERQGLRAEIGLADTVGCAWAAARYGVTTWVKMGGVRDFMLPMPLAALRLDRKTVSALEQAGLKHVRDLVERPRAPFAARFGNELLRRLDQALGGEGESIKPRLLPPSYIAERRFPEPIGCEEDVLATIEQLAHELSQKLERYGEGALFLQATLFRTDGKVYRIEAGAGTPLRDPRLIKRLFVERLAIVGDECDPGFGYDMVRLSAMTSERLDPVQSGLTGEDHSIEIAHLVDRLSARFGARYLTRSVPQDTHIPELAVADVPAQMARTLPAASLVEQDSLVPMRPIHLFTHPAAVEVIAEVPDGPPARFRWRRIMHEVVAAEGPERIAMEWWRNGEGHALTRDYFRVESRQGIRVWLYREGLYGREMIGNSEWRPNWYLHGLFA